MDATFDPQLGVRLAINLAYLLSLFLSIAATLRTMKIAYLLHPIKLILFIAASIYLMWVFKAEEWIFNYIADYNRRFPYKSAFVSFAFWIIYLSFHKIFNIIFVRSRARSGSYEAEPGAWYTISAVIIGSGLSVFAISYPLVNYALQDGAFTGGYLWRELKNGLLTLRFSSVSVGAALALSVSRMAFDLFGIHNWIGALAGSRWRALRAAGDLLLEEPMSGKFRRIEEFPDPFSQAVSRLKFWQAVFFAMVVCAIWAMFLWRLDSLPLPGLSPLLGLEGIPATALSVLLFFIVDDWYILESHLIKLRGTVNLYHKLRFIVVFCALWVLLIDGIYWMSTALETVISQSVVATLPIYSRLSQILVAFFFYSTLLTMLLYYNLSLLWTLETYGHVQPDTKRRDG